MVSYAVQELLGKEVIGSQGSKIGKVRDAVLDVGSWQVQALKVDLVPNIAQELGMKKFLKKSQVQIAVSDIAGVSDAIVLKLSKEQLQAMISEPAQPEKVEVAEQAAQ